MKNKLLVCCFLLGALSVCAQNPGVDVEKYELTLKISDTSNSIIAWANVSIKFTEKRDRYSLDLVQQDDFGKGMKVLHVTSKMGEVTFQQEKEKLFFSPKEFPADSNFIVNIKYFGEPIDGLIIGKNKFGNRTFFGDNWPNRARHWFPCNDHPADKAFVRFDITCPEHYAVTANGKLLNKELKNHQKNFVYETIVPIPTKVMVFGAAEFSYKELESVDNIPVSIWVYPENEEKGFYDYALAAPILKYFMDKVGPYPFAKLANVQSTTRFGGMENAGNIFYSEKSVTGKRTCESLIAHEIAHQWFGNSASEQDWPHIWLSEGFATFFTNIYMRDTHGEEVFRKRILDERDQVLSFYKYHSYPVVDTVTNNLMELLNANSYQKGGWYLYMLMQHLGEELFFSGISTYYDTFKLSNATTEDFIEVMENHTQLSIKDFTYQWLRQSGHPQISLDWEYKNGVAVLKIEQKQEKLFDFPLEIVIKTRKGNSFMKKIHINKKTTTAAIELDAKPLEIILDPEVKLLFERIKN